MTLRPFHLAFPVSDLARTRQFYVEFLGASVGRESERWIDFDFFGHQISAHLSEENIPVPTNDVEGKQVPVRHFGVILDRGDWQALADRLRAQKADFLIEPHIRFDGLPGEQATLFILDPGGNGLEFKSFGSDADIFRT